MKYIRNMNVGEVGYYWNSDFEDNVEAVSIASRSSNEAEGHLLSIVDSSCGDQYGASYHEQLSESELEAWEHIALIRLRQLIRATTMINKAKEVTE